jgi:DNA-binding GntR family transcriptional regulator
LKHQAQLPIEVHFMQSVRKVEPAYQQAYEIIREMIIGGSLPAGQKLTEESLAAKLNVSRTPIRESLRRLERDGLVVDKQVVKPTAKMLRDLYSLRILLEGYAAIQAAGSLTSEQLATLHTCIDTAKKGSKEDAMQSNTVFHDTIMQASENPYMLETYEKLRSMILLFRHDVVFYNRAHLQDEHEQIYNALANRSAESGESLMKEHLQNDLAFCLSCLKDRE